MAEEQDIKQETVEETEDTTNVEELTVEKTEEAVADAAQVLEELKADFDNRYKRLQADFENFKRRTKPRKRATCWICKRGCINGPSSCIG